MYVHAYSNFFRQSVKMAEGKKQPSGFKNFVSGGAGGVCVVLVGHPLDTIKVRLQTQPKPKPGESPMFKGTLDCATKTVKNEGFRGLYRGMLAPLLGVTPMFAISLYGYGVGKKIQMKSATDKLTIIQHFNAGMISGVFSTLIMVPGERVKCLMQIQQSQSKSGAKYSSSIDCARKLYREGGIRSLYRGTFATLLRDCPGSGMYYGGYQLVLSKLSPDGNNERLSPLKILFAGGIAGVMNWSIAIAPDTLKSRLQTAPDGKYNGIRGVFTDMVRKEGIGAMFKGFVPVMLRAFPANAAFFLGMEVTMRILNWILPN